MTPNQHDNSCVYYLAASVCCFLVALASFFSWPSLLMLGVLGFVCFGYWGVSEWHNAQGRDDLF